MKLKTLFLLCSLSLVACAQRLDDDAGHDDDQDQPDPDEDPTPDPDPAACDSDDDCAPIDGCSAAACVEGDCSSEPACSADEVCDEDLDACVEVVPPPPGSGSITCTETAGYVEVTISGGILAHLSASSVPSPTTAWKLAYGSAPGDWQIPYASDSAKDWKPWTTDGAVYKLRLPDTVTSFNFSLTDGTAADSEYWLDLDEYVVSGSTCAHVADGGSITRTATVVPNGTMTCAESGSYVNVTVSPGILHHLLKSDGTDADGTVSPTTSWKLAYGSNPGSWSVPYAAGSMKDWEYWATNGLSYVLQLPNDVTLFNFALTDGVNAYWFDLNEFDVSGSSCAHVADGGGITRTATVPIPPGTITCSVNGSDMTVTIAGGILDHLIGAAVSPTSSWKIQYGSDTDGWGVPYASGKPMASWVSNAQTYVLIMSSSVNNFNFALTDTGSVVRWFDLGSAEFVVSGAGCHVVGGGIVR